MWDCIVAEERQLMRKKIIMALTGAVLSFVFVSTIVVGVASAGKHSVSCIHAQQTEARGYSHSECANSEKHYDIWFYQVVCDDCHEIINYYTYQNGYNDHDLSGYSNGNWVCIDCGYEETPGTFSSIR